MAGTYSKNSGTKSTHLKILNTSVQEIEELINDMPSPIPQGWYRTRQISKELGYSYSHTRSLILDLLESEFT